MLYTRHYATPSGFDDLLMASDGEVLTGLCFCGSRDESRFIGQKEEKDLPVFRDMARWLDIYFSGRQPDFTPAYRLDGLTSFRREVFGIMERIPFGRLMTYGALAQQIAERRGLGRMSAQAVGGAVGCNPICINVPCHRVVGADGNLTGYRGGLHNKMALLHLEGTIV
ncbi:MAG: methylated-DNA--[protein]-cysteine S-methyltransferase [Bacteroidales bacterium]|nr:methylated-DNA--[protein]-cysteine S-methyltransferase [Bacteroidales bacterium]